MLVAMLEVQKSTNKRRNDLFEEILPGILHKSQQVFFLKSRLEYEQLKQKNSSTLDMNIYDVFTSLLAQNVTKGRTVIYLFQSFFLIEKISMV